MDLILCHMTADFDTLGAAIGLTRLHPGARIVLTGGSHPTVGNFLALHRDEYPLIERRAVNAEQVRSIIVVDTQWRDRLGKAAEWLDLPIPISLYDHHLEDGGDIPATEKIVEPVGATTTLIAEQLQQQDIVLTPMEATAMALGIHVDTGSLTYDHATVRDAKALTWLMEQGASLRAIAEYVEPGLSPQLQDLLTVALEKLHTEIVRGYTLAWVLLPSDEYVPGLSSLASHLMTLTETDVLLLASRYGCTDSGEERVTVIGRSRSMTVGDGVNLSELFQPHGGGGHPRAAALTVRASDPERLLGELLAELRGMIPHPPSARDLMSSPVRTIRPETTIAEAQRILLRYGHSGLSVVDTDGHLLGVISRRDLDIALHHGFSHAPVKGYMTTHLKTIAPETTLPEIEELMVTYDIGRLPVLDRGELVGIVTRTDVLRQLHQQKTIGERRSDRPSLRDFCPLPQVMLEMLGDRLNPALWNLLRAAAREAESRGWHLYVVGGAVRDLLLCGGGAPLLPDIDLVVDGFHRTAESAAGVELARALQEKYKGVRLQVHGRFQTAALLWHNDPQLDSLWIDIATARTEFYPYPAANPEVEASSIRQDLYRRDFTINALAIRLTPPREGELLDFFGGLLDLRDRQIRVLHANSFIEDPTRIYRAVRFAVRLGFLIEPQTEGYIRHAIASGIYHRTQSEMERTPALQTRLKRELQFILEAPYWEDAVQLLANLDALRCIHPSLELNRTLWWQLRLCDRWLKRFPHSSSLEHWEVLLEILIAYLEPSERGKVASGFQLAAAAIARLEALETTEDRVTERLAECDTLGGIDRPSQIVQFLQQYSLETLILLATRAHRSVRRILWKYLVDWSQVKPPLDGNDLKRMGYKPGKHYKQILDALLAATLDGELGETERSNSCPEELQSRCLTQAEAFVKANFPP